MPTGWFVNPLMSNQYRSIQADQQYKNHLDRSIIEDNSEVKFSLWDELQDSKDSISSFSLLTNSI